MILDDSGQIINPVICSAITNMGFVLDSNEFRYEKNITPDLVQKIVQFFKDYEEDLNLDKKCSEYYDRAIQKKHGFELLIATRQSSCADDRKVCRSVLLSIKYE